MILQLTNVALLLPFVIKQDLVGWSYLIMAISSIVYHYQLKGDSMEDVSRCCLPSQMVDRVLAKMGFLLTIFLLIKKLKTNLALAVVSMVWAALALVFYYDKNYLIGHSMWHVCCGMGLMFLVL